MTFLQQRRIIHRDRMSSNLLIASDRNKTVKISDFSMSRLQVRSAAPGLWLTPLRTSISVQL